MNGFAPMASILGYSGAVRPAERRIAATVANLGLEEADLGQDRLDQRRDAEEVDHTCQVVGEDRERDFGADVLSLP